MTHALRHLGRLARNSLFAAALFLPALARAQDSGWVNVFNGTDLTGLKIYGGGNAKVTNGMIVVSGGSGYLATLKEYTHYRVRVEWNNVGGGNSGYLYNIGKDGVWPSGLECQMAQGDVGSLWTTDCKFNSTGSGSTYSAAGAAINGFGVYGSSRKHFLKGSNQEKTGQWNTWEMYVAGDSLEIKVNGVAVMRISKLTYGGGTPLVKGRMGLQIEGATVQWRNWQVQDLSGSNPLALQPRRGESKVTPVLRLEAAAGRLSILRPAPSGGPGFAAFDGGGRFLGLVP